MKSTVIRIFTRRVSLGDFWTTHHAWQVFAVEIPEERPKP